MNTDVVNDSSSTGPSGVDDAVGVPDSKWYVAIVNARHEKVVADRLKESGYESYVASQKEIRVWRNGRKKMIDRVVITSIVFVKCTETERKEIVTYPYINRFMVNRSAESDGKNRPLATIPEVQIDRLRFMLGQSDLPVSFDPARFRINDNVRVVRGRLRGLEGEIMRNPDGSHRLVVAISILGGATVVIDPMDVEKIS